ncbi:MAG: hypothetical protein AB1644_07885 [Candidatus Zixiibacteriota bacterium]
MNTRHSSIGTIVVFCLLVSAAVLQAGPTLRDDPGIPDSVSVDSVHVALPTTPQVAVRFYNDEPLGALEITLIHTKTNIQVDSFSFVGGRTFNSGAFQGFSVDSNVVVIFCVPSSQTIPAGSGLLGNLFFSYTGPISPQLITIDSVTTFSNQIERSTTFSDETFVPFVPQFRRGYINLQVTCCVGNRGNIDGSPDQVVDISDLQFLVDFLMGFPGGRPPDCAEEGNIDGSPDGTIDISDLSYLIDWLLLGVVPNLPPCP